MISLNRFSKMDFSAFFISDQITALEPFLISFLAFCVFFHPFFLPFVPFWPFRLLEMRKNNPF